MKTTEQLEKKFNEFINATIEAGNHANWEERYSNFNPNNKDKVDEYITFYSGLLNKINITFNELKEIHQYYFNK